MSEISQLSRRRRRAMQDAAAAFTACEDVMRAQGSHILQEILPRSGLFLADKRYPDGEVFDQKSGAQYYYHAHRERPGEHGHFHTFVSEAAIPPEMRISPLEAGHQAGRRRLAHLVAISIDSTGSPIELFVTNRWVTDETWYRAEDVIRLIDGFRIEQDYPSPLANRWLCALLQLYQPQIAALLHRRDRLLEEWIQAHPRKDPLNDTRLEVIARLPIAVGRHIARLQAAASA